MAIDLFLVCHQIEVLPFYKAQNRRKYLRSNLLPYYYENNNYYVVRNCRSVHSRTILKSSQFFKNNQWINLALLPKISHLTQKYWYFFYKQIGIFNQWITLSKITENPCCISEKDLCNNSNKIQSTNFLLVLLLIFSIIELYS